MSVDRNDLDASLVIGLHEAVATDVEEDLVDLREGDGVDRTEAIRRQEFANGVAWHHGVTDVTNIRWQEDDGSTKFWRASAWLNPQRTRLSTSVR